MRATGSTPMATRWRWCSALAVALVVSGCIARTERYWVPTPGDPRLNIDELRTEADRFLAVECPRLMGDSTSAAGAAGLRLEVEPSGEVVEAHLNRSSGDERVDGIFGALAARLTVTPTGRPRDRFPLRLELGYSCAPRMAITTARFP